MQYSSIPYPEYMCDDSLFVDDRSYWGGVQLSSACAAHLQVRESIHLGISQSGVMIVVSHVRRGTLVIA